MKKFKALGLILSVFAVLVLAACGGGSDSAIQEWIDANGTEMTEMFQDEGMSANMEAGSGNEIVLTIVIDEEVMEELTLLGYEIAVSMLEDSLNGMSPIFVIAANEARDEIELDELTFTIIYEDHNGEELVSQSFDSE